MTPLITIGELSKLTGLDVRTLRSLHQKRLIPHIRIGHRTRRYQLDRVLAALGRLEVKAIG